MTPITATGELAVGLSRAEYVHPEDAAALETITVLDQQLREYRDLAIAIGIAPAKKE